MSAKGIFACALSTLAGLGVWTALPRARADTERGQYDGRALEAATSRRGPRAVATSRAVYPGERRLAESARSVRVLEEDEPIHFGPSDKTPRRGAAMRGAYLPLYATHAGPGCQARWYLVGPEAWLCGERTEVSPRTPLAPANGPDPLRSGLPYDYYFIGPDGSFGYDHLSEADLGVPDAQLEPGFAVAFVEIARRHGEPFGLTTKQLWLPLRDVGPARPSTFAGTTIDGELEAVAWTHSDETPVYRRPRGPRYPDKTLPRHTRVHVLTTDQKGSETWLSVGDSEWLRRRDVRRALRAPVPDTIEQDERWIDVDLAEQTVVAYQGREPVFATLASTGRGPKGSEQATPPGNFRIWVKLRTSDMTNLEDIEARRYYAMEEVPWVMFFKQGYGLHGAYWHRSFGNVRSHGCVNLAPKDAKWLFDWTSPRLPAGWRAVLPGSYDPGTVVRVH